MRREPSPDARLKGDAAELGADSGGRPGPAAREPVDHAEQRPDRSSVRAASHGRRCSQPHSSIPTSRRRPPLPLRTSSGSAAWVEVVLGERERLPDTQPGAPQHDDHPAQPQPVAVVADVAHDGHDLIERLVDRRGS